MQRKRTYNSAKRVVTSCTECTRRKQRCDRQVPCNICVSRKAAHLCSYSAPKPKPPPEATHEVATDADSGITSLVDQLGYANTFDFMALSILDDEDTTKLSTKDSIPDHTMKRYHVLIQQLPPAEVLRRAADFFFNELYWILPIIERPFFDELFNPWLELRSPCSSEGGPITAPHEVMQFGGLLAQLLAVVMQLTLSSRDAKNTLGVDYGNISVNVLSRTFYRLGLDIMALVGRSRSTMTSIQHSMMHMQKLKNDGHGAEAWSALGEAIREAQMLGLHSSTQQNYSVITTENEDLIGSRDFWYNEGRRRLWVVMFSCDAWMAQIMRRPREIHLEDCTALRPLNCEFPTTFPTEPMQYEHIVSRFAPQLFYYDLAYKYHLVSAYGLMSTPVLDYSIVETCHRDILDLAARLPLVLRSDDHKLACEKSLSYIIRQRPRLLSDTWASIMALHRPHIHVHPESRGVAVESALQVLAAQEQVFQVISERHYPIYGFSFFTVDAVVFLASLQPYVIAELPQTISSIIGALEAAESRLKVMQARNVIASSGIGLVRKCLDMYKAWHRAPEDSYLAPDDFAYPVSVS